MDDAPTVRLPDGRVVDVDEYHRMLARDPRSVLAAVDRELRLEAPLTKDRAARITEAETVAVDRRKPLQGPTLSELQG